MCYKLSKFNASLITKKGVKKMKKFWFPVLITVVFAVMTGLSIYDAVDNPQSREWHSDEPAPSGGQWSLIVTSASFLTVFLFIWLICYVSGISIIAKLEAFQEKTQDVFKTAVSETKGIEISALKELPHGDTEIMKLGELAYKELAKDASGRIKEYRNQIEQYNKNLQAYKKWNKFAFSKGFIPDVPANLDLISY
jgi:hypothetical protein